MSLSRTFTACLWAIVLASIAAAADGYIRWNREEASKLTVLLLPSEAPDEAAREARAAEIESNPAVASARWLSPKDLAQQTSQSVSRELWPSLFGEDEAWLPWIAEIRFANPVADSEAVKQTVADLDSDSYWQLVLWDEKRFAQHVENESRSKAFWVLPLIIFIFGLIALAFGKPRQSWIKEFLANSVLAVGVMAGLVALAQSAGFRVDARVWQVALAVSFVVAGLVAPVLKGTTLKAESQTKVDGNG